MTSTEGKGGNHAGCSRNIPIEAAILLVPSCNIIIYNAFYPHHNIESDSMKLQRLLLQPAWLPPLPSVDVTANLPGYIILSGYQLIRTGVVNVCREPWRLGKVEIQRGYLMKGIFIHNT